jgi:hypothetical protein
MPLSLQEMPQQRRARVSMEIVPLCAAEQNIVLGTVFVAIDELMPAAGSHDSGHLSIVGIIAGMMITALSLWMLQ